MRLIDADELKRSISQNNKIPRIFQQVINAQPTVYNIDKVVEKLSDMAIERYGNDGGMGGEKVVNLDDAIEIVKAGLAVEDDVCEWKTAGANNAWGPNCEPKFKRCPYCGIKIKVVK